MSRSSFESDNARKMKGAIRKYSTLVPDKIFYGRNGVEEVAVLRPGNSFNSITCRIIMAEKKENIVRKRKTAMVN